MERGPLNLKPLIGICLMLLFAMFCAVVKPEGNTLRAATIYSAKPVQYMGGTARAEPTPTSAPMPPPSAQVTVKVSRYNPELGGTNCFDYRNGGCQSPMANGERWEHQYDYALACAPQWPFGTMVEIQGEMWECKDRGGKIKQVGPNTYWVDQLSRIARVPYGTELPAKVWFPPETIEQ